MKDICCIGHITLDKIITPSSTVYMPGGCAYYSSHAISCMNHTQNFKLVTAIAASEMKAADDIRHKGIDVKVLPSQYSVYFENKYGENQNNRTQRVLAKADPFTIEGLKDISADIFYLGSLLADDFSLEVLKYLSSKGTLAVEAQGYLREVKDQKVYAIDWKEKQEAFQYIDILKINEHEMEVITGSNNPMAAARQLAAWGIKEALITLGSLGSIIYANGECYEIPAYPPKEVIDATGCGDTYVTGYLYMRSQGASYRTAGCFAAAMSTLKLEHSGPFCNTEADIWALIKQYTPEMIEE